MSENRHGPGGQQFQRKSTEDALLYLDQVKHTFRNEPQVYMDFLDIMKDFKEQRLDTPEVVSRVSLLFSGHHELIVGFNALLPPGYRIPVEDPVNDGTCDMAQNFVWFIAALPQQMEAPSPSWLGSSLQLELQSAINFQNKVKNRFRDQPDIYQQFLEILVECRSNPVNNGPMLDYSELHARVAQLFRNEEDLIREFAQFLFCFA